MNTLDQERYYLVSYAQNREDLYIRAIFGEEYRGFYVDVGSNHPIHHSVTKLLYRSGWHGINVDPNKELMEFTAYDRSRDIQICCGVGSEPGKLTFRQYRNHGLSTFSREMQRDYSGQQSEFTDTFTDIEVEIRTLENILIEHKVETVDLLKVDVEGYEQQVLNGNDWKKFRPKIICIEANHKTNDWDAFLKSQGYIIKTTDGLNDYYVDKNCELAKTPVRLAETALVYPHIVDNDVAGLVALQGLRAESVAIVHKAMRVPNRQASARLLKETIRLSLHELKYLVKEHSKSLHTVPVPAHPIEALESTTDIERYVKRVNKVYEQSFESIWQYEQAQVPKSKTAGLMKRAKLVGYDAPRLVLGEAGKVARRRMK